MNRFIDERKDNWKRLEDLLELLRGTSLRGLSKLEVREFGELYRRASTDLAIARAETRDPKLINYLNSLVIRAHGKIYRADSNGASIVKKFFVYDFPRAVRDSSRYWMLVTAIFFISGTFSFLLTHSDPAFGTALGLDDIKVAAETNRQWWMRLNDSNPIGSSQILTNNIQVSILAFAFGAFFGIGTLYIVLMNGISIGGTLGVCYRTDPAFGNALVNFMVAHGVLELTAIFLAGGAGMMIGYALIVPGDVTRSQALKKAGGEAAKIVIGCAIILVFTGFVEGFLSPSGAPLFIKYGTGIISGLLFAIYIAAVGRNEPAAVELYDDAAA